MRGRRRGRNRPSSQDSTDPGSDVVSAPVGTGSVTLIENLPAPGSPSPTSAPPAPPAESSIAQPSTSTQDPSGPVSAQRRIEETISDVATAHAELDNVLPPPAPPSTPPSKKPEMAVEPERVSDTPVAPPATGVVPHKEREETSEPSVAAVVAPLPTPVDEPVAAHTTEEPVREVQSASGNPLPRVLAVANQKGGVGKTTTSVNLGAALAELGFRVLVIDLDPQGNATTGLGIDARNFELSMYDVLMRDSSLEDCVEPTSMKNLFVAPATIALAGAEIELVPAFSRELKLKRSIESIIDDFDYVLIDCPPSLGLITVNALAAADEVLVPIQCEYYALEGLSQLMRNVHLVASNLNPQLDISTIVLTMYDARTKLADQVANEVRLHFGAKVCRNVIPRTVRLSEAPSFGQPITAFDPASRGAIAYRELAKEVSGGTT